MVLKTDKLDSKTSISAHISEVFGVDSNGNRLEASNTVEFQQNAERGLKVEIGPPTSVEGNWQCEVSISEIKGSETKLMGFSVATFDELKMVYSTICGNKRGYRQDFWRLTLFQATVK